MIQPPLVLSTKDLVPTNKKITQETGWGPMTSLSGKYFEKYLNTNTNTLIVSNTNTYTKDVFQNTFELWS